MPCLSLLTASRNTIRKAVRERFLLGIEKFETDWAQRQAEHNRHCAVFDDTPPLYDYSQIFLDAIAPCIPYDIVRGGTLHDVLCGHMDVLEFVSPEHERYQPYRLDSYRMGCIRSEGPVRYERFIQFIGWLQLVQPAVVPHIMQRVTSSFQSKMFSDEFSMEHFRLALKWDKQYAGALLFHRNDSHLHYMMKTPTLVDYSSLLLLDKLKEIVAVHGDRYLVYIPTSDPFATNTLVTSLLRHSQTTDFDEPTHAVLAYLIHACPAALKVQSYCARRHTAFSAVCERWNDPGIARHVWMVDNVMRYADITDILDAVSAHRKTLLEYAKECKNVLVLDYIRQRFGRE